MARCRDVALGCLSCLSIVKSGAKDGRAFHEHCDEWLRKSGCHVGADICNGEVAARSVVWVPSPFAVLIAHKQWDSWATSIVLSRDHALCALNTHINKHSYAPWKLIVSYD